MKRFISLLFTFIFVFSVSWIAMAEEETITLELWVDKQEAVVNGKKVTLDVPPTVVKGRTLVPLRFIGEALGAKVDYEPKARKITVTMENLVALKNKVEALQKEIADAQEKCNARINELETKVQDLTGTISQKESEITALRDSISQKESEIANLQAIIDDLNNQIADLKKQLEESGVKDDTAPPAVTSDNVKEGMVVSEPLPLQFTVKDDSKIVFTRIKLGSYVLSEELGNYGVLKPEQFVSGEYPLTLEAIDAFANKTTFKMTVVLKNSEKMEPVKINAVPLDMPIDQTRVMPYLNMALMNKSLSNIEVIKIECFDKQGNLDEVMPGVNLFELYKTQQFGIDHLWVHSKDKIMLPCAVDTTNSGKKAKEYFDGWKVFVTLYDSVMEKEFKIESTIK